MHVSLARFDKTGCEMSAILIEYVMNNIELTVVLQVTMHICSLSEIYLLATCIIQ
jgi:hypothetical protein